MCIQLRLFSATLRVAEQDSVLKKNREKGMLLAERPAIFPAEVGPASSFFAPLFSTETREFFTRMLN